MLINIRISELQSNTRNTIPLAITITIALNYPLFKLLPYDVAILSNNYYMNNVLYDISLNKYNSNYFNNLNYYNNNLSFVTSNMWDGNLAETGHITSIGSVLYTNYNMWLLIASFILLLAMVGCIVITLKSDTYSNKRSFKGALSLSRAPIYSTKDVISSEPLRGQGNNISKRWSSTLAIHRGTLREDYKLDSWFITGLSDAEGSFSVSVSKNRKLKSGWRILPSFTMGLGKKDRALLNLVKSYFGVGYIYDIPSANVSQFRVQSIKYLEVILQHFDEYPLVTKKREDYILFRQAFEIIKSKGHITNEGFSKILALKNSMNLGLFLELKKNFPDLEKITRTTRRLPPGCSTPSGCGTEIKDIVVNNPQWMSGFTTGEGCFSVSVESAQTTALKYTVRTRFIITQHIRDYPLMESFKEYFQCGSVVSSGNIACFMVNSLSEINKNIKPFFDKYPILGKKHLDYLSFCTIVVLKTTKSHLTTKGLNDIRSIVDSMNSKR